MRLSDKPEDILLSICIYIITVFVIGLTVISCGTTKKTKDISVSHSSQVTNSTFRREVVSDSMSLTALIRRWQNNYSINIRRYVPVVDSAGMVHNLLSEDITIRDDTSLINDSVSSCINDYNVNVNDSIGDYKSDTALKNQTTEEDKDTIFSRYMHFILVFLVIGFIIFFILRIKSWFYTD